jgi:predicted ester cyclase
MRSTTPRRRVLGLTATGSQFDSNFEVTAKNGPMTGKRVTLDEAGLYTVTDGKITQFYDMGS